MQRKEINMIGVILVSHGNFAAELLKSAEMIIGKQDNVRTLTLNPGDNPQSMRCAIEKAYDEVCGNSGVIILADLFGGSPSNAAVYMMEKDVSIITGMNMSMLLQLLTNRESPREEAARDIISAGREGILNVCEYLKGDKNDTSLKDR